MNDNLEAALIKGLRIVAVAVQSILSAPRFFTPLRPRIARHMAF